MELQKSLYHFELVVQLFQTSLKIFVIYHFVK